MAEPPVLDQLDTRLLETREVIRSFVKQAEVVDATETGLLLRTSAETTIGEDEAPGGMRRGRARRRSDRLGKPPGRPRQRHDPARALRRGRRHTRQRDADGGGAARRASASETRRESDRVLYATARLRVEVGLDPFTICGHHSGRSRALRHRRPREERLPHLGLLQHRHLPQRPRRRPIAVGVLRPAAARGHLRHGGAVPPAQQGRPDDRPQHARGPGHRRRRAATRTSRSS